MSPARYPNFKGKRRQEAILSPAEPDGEWSCGGPDAVVSPASSLCWMSCRNATYSRPWYPALRGSLWLPAAGNIAAYSDHVCCLDLLGLSGLVTCEPRVAVQGVQSGAGVPALRS
jgi:hypothetical protein